MPEKLKENKKALDWVVNNQNDPRAEKIIKNLGIDRNDIKAWDYSVKNQNDPRSAKIQQKVLESVGKKYAEPGFLESASIGINQGLSFGLSDEILGGFRAAKRKLTEGGNFTDLYKQERDALRAYYDKAKEANPIAFGIGEYGTALIPGTGIAKGVGTAGKIGRAALSGGLAGFGYSKSEDPRAIVAETAMGSALGAGAMGALPLAAKGAGKIAQAGKWAGKKGLKTLTGVPEEVMEGYVRRPKETMMAKDITDLGEGTLDAIEQLENQRNMGSKAAVAALPENRRISGKPLKEAIQKEIDNYNGKKYTKADEFAENELKDFLKRFSSNTATPKGKPKGSVGLKQIKDVIQRLDDNIAYKKKQKDNLSTAGRQLNNSFVKIRRKFDKVLKDAVPEYKEKMKNVAKDTAALENAKKIFQDESKTIGKLKQIGFRPKEKITEGKILKELGERTGKDIYQENLDRVVREAFDKDFTRGSRNVNLHALVAGGMTDASALAYASGGMIGSLFDKFGSKIAKTVLNAYLKSKNVANNPSAIRRAIAEGGPELMGFATGKNINEFSTGQ